MHNYRCKALSIIMAMLMIIAAVPFTAHASNPQMTIAVSSEKGMPGTDVYVNISLVNNPGVSSIKIEVVYDDILTLTGVSYNTELGGQTSTPPNYESPVTLNWISPFINFEGDAVYATLKFRINENALGETAAQIKILYDENNIYDLSNKNIDCIIENGIVTIISCIPGDINNDGLVNNKDATRLFQYLSAWDVEVNTYALDVNGDGVVNNKDATRLFQYLSNWDVKIYAGAASSSRCFHKMKQVTSVAPSCNTDGNIDYWICTSCGKYFADADGKKEIRLSDTIIYSGHTFAKVWSHNETYHWHSATCGHTVTNDYSKHDFDEKNICTICGYEKQNVSYEDLYLNKYREIGRTVNLITASDFTAATGANRLFTNELYNVRLDLFDYGKQQNLGTSYSSFEAFTEENALDVSAKVSFGARKDKNNRFMTNKLPSIDVSAALGYETKKAKETSEYIYSWKYIYNGVRAEISEFKNKEKLAGMLSPEFISDALKVRNGEISAADFVELWGTHVITSGIYGAMLSVNYYEVSNHVSDYSSYKANLDAKFNKRFLKTGLDIEATVDTSGISTSTEKDALKWLSINGVAKNTFMGSSLDDLVSSYKTWQSNFEKDVAGNSVLVDIGDSGLCCIWYLLDDSFDDVKEILDDYMYSQCSDLYAEYASKINNLKMRDDVSFDKETGTLELNFAPYQKQGNLSGFKSDSYVAYREIKEGTQDTKSTNAIIEITPYYNNEQVKRIVIDGAYGLFDSAGQKIDKAIDTSIKLLQGDWYDDLKIQLSNVAIAGSEDYSAIDFTAVKNSNPLTVICIGNNEIVGHRAFGSKKAQAALVANIIVLKSNSTTDSLTLYGGFGRFKEWDSDKGGDGASALIANNITVDMAGTLSAYGGDGGKGADGTNGTDGTGENGGKGVNGGAGNYAVHSESQIVVKNGTVNLYGGASGSSGRGGNGGKGRTGANGNANPTTYDGWPGGTGGKGGDSGNVMLGSFAANCGYIIPDNSTATVYCEIGKTGNVGEHGKGGDGGDGGKRFTWWNKDGPKGSPGSDGSYGRVLYDVTTAGVYNNADNGNVTHSIENGMLKITVSGEAAPGLGGFVQSTSSAPYKVFYHTIVAKVPVGYKLEHASNAIGDGAHFEWMTSNSGTGEFETYVYRTTCGSTGTFNDFGYVYLYADDYTTVSYPVEWYVSYANITE